MPCNGNTAVDGRLLVEALEAAPGYRGLPPGEGLPASSGVVLGASWKGEEASQTFTEAWEAARIMEDAHQRGAALRAVALSLAQVGHGALAWRSLGTSRMPASGALRCEQWRCLWRK